MNYIVGFKEPSMRKRFEVAVGKELVDVSVEADDRWDATIEASKVWGLDKLFKMQDLFNIFSVRKGEIKRVREWRKI